jgi:preprotein translocase subunit SecB
MEENTLYPLQLLDVRLYEADLKRILSEKIRDDESDDEQAPAPQLGVRVEVLRHDEIRSASVRLTLEVDGPDGESPDFHLSLTLEGFFEAQVDLDEIDEAKWEEFGNTSAIALIWPYAREALHSFTRRMRVDLPVLPTLNRLAMGGAEEPQ